MAPQPPNPSGDRKLSDQEWGDAVRTAMRALDFDHGQPGGRAPAPWVAIHHGDSTAGNDHVHVAVSLVREDGTRASNWQDRVKASGVCRELDERYGLTVVDGRTAGSKPGPTRGEDEKARRMGAAEPDRVRLERLVRASAASSRERVEQVILHVFGGNVAVSSSQVQQQSNVTVAVGDRKGLFDALHSIGMDAADLTALEEALNEEEAAGEGRPGKALGPRVKAWVGDVAIKGGSAAAKGAAAGLGGQAVRLLAEYYGVGA